MKHPNVDGVVAGLIFVVFFLKRFYLALPPLPKRESGKAGDVARVISDPTGDAEMPSFLPPYLKFLDDAVPALHLRKALGPNGVRAPLEQSTLGLRGLSWTSWVSSPTSTCNQV